MYIRLSLAKFTSLQVAIWNTMITVYGLNGRGKQAIELFEAMKK